MKYRNAKNILPEQLLLQIQEYIQGEYIYVPIKDKFAVEVATDYKTELEKRDAHIYIKYLEGLNTKQLASSYNLSESSIRRIVIKQRKGYMQMNEKIRNILVNWRMQNSEIKQIYKTTWQIGESYVLKVYSDLNMLKRNLKILNILGNHDIPVAAIIPSFHQEQYVSDGETYYFLSQKLKGSNIVKMKDDKNLALMMGKIIADLHLAFKICENEESFNSNSLLQEMNGWVKNSFEKMNWKYLSKETFEEVVSKLASVYDQLIVQLIHRDVHFGNFLFDKGTFSGYIDFDLSQRNIRIFDICYFLLGLLSEEGKFDITEEAWFAFATNVFEGYEKKLVLSEAEKHAVPYVMECIELLFIAYFENHNDVYCAENAYKIFSFISKHEERIWSCI